ncbi:DUF6777 domain-containing protein, partial [Streptomyces sp. NPDC002004]
MPQVAALTAAVVAAVALVLLLTRPEGFSNRQQGEVFLQSAASTGQDPFTESTVRAGGVPSTGASPPGEVTSAGGGAVRTVDGDTPGLYGGTRRLASCDVPRQISVLG